MAKKQDRKSVPKAVMRRLRASGSSEDLLAEALALRGRKAKAAAKVKREPKAATLHA